MERQNLPSVTTMPQHSHTCRSFFEKSRKNETDPQFNGSNQTAEQLQNDKKKLNHIILTKKCTIVFTRKHDQQVVTSLEKAGINQRPFMEITQA